jgi:hypothetical protein
MGRRETAGPFFFMWTYPEELLAALAAHGLAPRRDTPPDLVREYVNDLYRLELRTLRDQLIAKQIPKDGYRERVVELRKKYWVLTLNLDAWQKIAK